MYWHLTIAADERLALFPTPTVRRHAVRALVRVGGPRVLLFFVADDHAHLVLAGDAPGRLAQRLALAWRPFASSALQPARVRPVESRGHLASLVPYVLGQARHHGLSGHPADQVGSCFADLVGARAIGFATVPLREALPRLASEEVYGAVGLPVLEPAEDLAGASLPALVRATADALAVDDLGAREPAVVRARATLARLARAQGYQPARAAEALGTTPRHLRRLEAVPAWPELEYALRMRVRLAEAMSRTDLAR